MLLHHLFYLYRIVIGHNKYTGKVIDMVRSCFFLKSRAVYAFLIDLALVSTKTQLLDCSIIPPLANADRNGLELSFKCMETQYT